MPHTFAPPPPSEILLAVTVDNTVRLTQLLEGHLLTFVKTQDEAMQHLLRSNSFAIIIIDVHFHESQMFTLMGDIRTHAKYRKVPMLCVLGATRGRALSEVAIQGLDHAVKAMTANGFLDLTHFPDDEEGNARIRRIIDYLILINGDLQHLARAGDPAIRLDERRRAR